MQRHELEQQFEQDIQQHRLLIHKVCNIYSFTLHDREDLFQDIVIQLWRAYPNFKGQSRLSTYMYRVAINTAISGLRRKDNKTLTYEPEQLPQYADPATVNPADERLAQLHAAIATLNEIERAIVMLYLEEKNYEEMEQILGINQGNLRVKMYRIKDKLRELTKTN